MRPAGRPMRRWHEHAREVLAFLGTQTRTGRDIREYLNAGRPWWRRWSGPACYQLLAEMEDAGLLKRGVDMRLVSGVSVPVHTFCRRED
jgi:DNA-binding PadR family transcriptional regulator